MQYAEAQNNSMVFVKSCTKTIRRLLGHPESIHLTAINRQGDPASMRKAVFRIITNSLLDSFRQTIRYMRQPDIFHVFSCCLRLNLALKLVIIRAIGNECSIRIYINNQIPHYIHDLMDCTLHDPNSCKIESCWAGMYANSVLSLNILYLEDI